MEGNQTPSHVTRNLSYDNLAQSVHNFQQNYAAAPGVSTWAKPQRDVETEAMGLFVNYPVAEIRSLEIGLKRDIEKKKQELRMMVGERYRELIEAADSITAMKTSITEVNSQFAEMKHMTTVESLSSLAKANDPKGSSEAEEKKNKIYRIACQIKLLVDTPEQIWHGLESTKYLVACRLFLIARQIFNNLQSRNEKDLKVMQQFPVIQKQWDAISHFRSQILDGSRNFMKQANLSHESLGETLCAIVLLQRITPLQAFEEFLEARKAAILGLLSNFKNSATPIMEFVCQIIGILQTTIELINLTFVAGSDGSSVLEKYLTNLGKHFSVVSSTAKSESSIAGLYSSKTNVHTISRFLPDSIHRFTPYINFGEPAQKGVQIEMLQERSEAWLKFLTKEIQNRGQEMFLFLDNAQSLAKTRNEAWKVLKISPGAQIRPDWEQVCKNVFGHSFCLWRDVFRDLFNHRSQGIITESFAPLRSLPSQIIAPVLVDLRKQGAPNVLHEKNVGKYVWWGEDEKGSASSVADRSLGFTPAVIKIQTTLDQVLQRIKVDVDHIFVSTPAGPASDSLEQDVYFIASDSQALRNALQRACVDAVFALKGELEKMLQGIHDTLESLDEETLEKERPALFDTMLFIGRISRSIATRTKNLSLVLQLSAQSTGDPAKLRRQYLTGLKGSKSDSDTVLEKLQQTFTDLYISSHFDWVRWLVEEVTQSARTGLTSSDWKDLAKKSASWEVVAVDDEGEKSDPSTFVKLPVQSSSFISDSLFFLTKEIHRQSGHTLDKSVIQHLMVELTERLFPVFEEFWEEVAPTGKLSDKGAVQLLFDVQFLSKVVKGSWETSSKMAEYQAMVSRLTSTIKTEIDPIDLAIYETHVLKRVERFYNRSSVLFGTLTSLNEPVFEAKKVPSLKEQHNLLSLAPQAKRFTFLPISSHGGVNGTQKTIDAGLLNQGNEADSQARFTRRAIKINLSSDNPLSKQKKFDGIAEMAMHKGPSFLRGVWSGFGVFGTQEAPASPGFS